MFQPTYKQKIKIKNMAKITIPIKFIKILRIPYKYVFCISFDKILYCKIDLHTIDDIQNTFKL